MTKGTGGEIKRGESILDSNQFSMCSSQPGTPREVHGVTEKRTGRRVIEVTKRRRGRVKKRETNLANNQFPKCSPQPRTPKEIHRVKWRREGGGRR